MDQWREIIYLNEFLGNVREFYAHIFRAIHWCLGFFKSYIKADKAHIATRKGTVNNELDQVERTCRRAYIARIKDEAASYGDVCTIGNFLLMSDLTHNHGVANFLSSLARDVFKENDA